jgi:hypothetical protein
MVHAKNRTSFHRMDLLSRFEPRQDVFHEDDGHAPHGPGIHAATPLTPTSCGKKVECPLFLPSFTVMVWWVSPSLRVAAETQTACTNGNGNAGEKVALGKVQ